MGFFRSSLFLSLFLLFDKASFFVFFSICFIFVIVDRKNPVTIHNALTTTLCVYVYVFRFPGTLMLSLLLFHSFIHSIIDRFTSCRSVVFLLPIPVYQFACSNLIISYFRKRKKKKKEKVEDNNLFSAQETHLLK
jgi:hypothetical protein